MERIIRTWIVDSLNAVHFFSPFQHGFLKGRSTTTNLLSSVENWVSALDSGKSVDVIYLDIAKAFDTVSHEKLLYKFKKLGLGFVLSSWVESFVIGRKQRVAVNRSFSGVEEVVSGIPQGSVLGPLLFAIFINDLPDCVRFSDISIYADDTKLSLDYEDMVGPANLQRDLDAVLEWFHNWQLRRLKAVILPL